MVLRVVSRAPYCALSEKNKLTTFHPPLLTGSSGTISQLTQSTTGPESNRHHRRHFAKEKARNAASAGRLTKGKQFFQEQHALLRKQQEAAANRQRSWRKQQVVIKRKYRVGEYPDIQIKLRDIVEPIMMLCERHVGTASEVFAGFFSSIVLSSEFQHAGLSTQLLERLQSVLSSSKHSSSFVRCLHLAYFSTIVASPQFATDVAIRAADIGGSTLASGSYHSGELILEELLSYRLHTRDRTLRIGAVGSDEAVAEYRDQLYKVLGTVQASNLLVALASTCCSVDESKAALQARIAGDLPLAIASYMKAESVLAALNDEVDDARDKLLSAQFEEQRCYWDRLECLDRLNHWEKLELELLRDGRDDRDDLSFLWKQKPPYLQQGLGHCVRAYVGAMEKHHGDIEAKEEQRDKIRAFLDAAQSQPHVWDQLASGFSTELCLMYLELGEVGRVRALVETFFATFLTRWQSTSTAATVPRLDLIQALSSAVQLGEVLTLTQSSSDGNEQQYVALNRRWTSAVPSGGTESVKSWSRFYMVQSVAGRFLLARGEDNGVLSTPAKHALRQDGAQVMLQYAKAAVSNDVLALASKYLKDYREVCNKQQLPKVSALMIDVFVSHVLKLAERQMHKTHSSDATGGAGPLSNDAITAVSRYYHAAARMFDNDDILTVMESSNVRERVAIGELEARAFGKASQFYLAVGHDHATAKEYFTRSIDVFDRSCRAVTAHAHASATDDDATVAVFRSCRLSFVTFLVDLLFKDGKGDTWEVFVGREALTRMFVENVLAGMAAGDRECSNYLPQLCEAIAPFPALVALTEHELLHNVPMWTCLRWAAQLMALLNGPISTTIVRVLEKVRRSTYGSGTTCRGLRGAHNLLGVGGS